LVKRYQESMALVTLKHPIIMTTAEEPPTSPHSALFTLHVHMTLLLSLACVCLSQQVSLAWCHGACCTLFPVLLTPNWLMQMAALPESGSDGGFFLLKGNFSSPHSPCACSGREIGSGRSFLGNLLVSLARKLVFELALYELD